MAARKEQLWIAIPDPHAPLHDRPATRCIDAAGEIAQPTGVLWLGDIGEFETVSHWRWKRRRRPPLEYVLADADMEIQKVNEYLDDREAVFQKVGVKDRRVTLGNHDEWLNHLCEENPFIDRKYRAANAMKLRERGYKVHPFNAYDLCKIGKLRAYHGHFVGGQYHARNHCLKLGASVIYGHHHDVQNASVQTLGGHHAAWPLGCTRDMNAPFLGGRPTNWGHAFALIHVLPSGASDVEVVRVEAGRAYVWGNAIDGNKPKARKRKRRAA